MHMHIQCNMVKTKLLTAAAVNNTFDMSIVQKTDTYMSWSFTPGTTLMLLTTAVLIVYT